MPGPELHLNAINAALHGEFIRELSHTAVALGLVTAAALALSLSLSIRSPWLRLLALVAVDCADVGVSLHAFDQLNLYIPCLSLLLQLNTTVLLGLVADFAFERVEKTRVR